MTRQTRATPLKALREAWESAWPQALADWSPFIQLHTPTWCETEREETREKLTQSFAMIRLNDHSVIISLRQIQERGLADFAPEILAHEIGHHVFCPSDLTDNARLIARIRRGLPTVENHAPYIGNLYSDLLINDRLQRNCNRRIAEVYRRLQPTGPTSSLWLLYMRIYEVLWNLEPMTLASERVSPQVNQDAVLGARLVRVYSKDWLRGAGRFACLCLPYVIEQAQNNLSSPKFWCDAVQSGIHGTIDGLIELGDDEDLGPIHPAEDPELTGLDPTDLTSSATGSGRVSSEASGRKSTKGFRDPFEYAEILKASGVALNEREIAVQYYKERALPYLVPFPTRLAPRASEPLPEGVESWDGGDELDRIDWFESLRASPVVIPGVTTKQRQFGTMSGTESEQVPLDLYLGVDCSGSMRDPALNLSFPILAGAIISLSALRAGASVKVVLSGEPGQTVSMDDFSRDSKTALRTMVNYLGTGYCFGIHRLAETFHEQAQLKRPVHILIVSDQDFFWMLEEKGNDRLGWDVAKQALNLSGGGGTCVLQLPGYESNVYADHKTKVEQLRRDGWQVAIVNSHEDLVAFARQFSRSQYHQRGIERLTRHPG